MNWTDWVWWAIGLGLGFLLGRRGMKAAVAAVTRDHLAAVEAARSETQALRSQLEQTQLAYSLAAEMSQLKGGFLARISHELRSPLSGVIGLHQLILNGLADSPEEERDFVQQSYDSALKMVKLLDEIIDVAKTEHGTAHLDFQPVNLANLMHDVYRLTHLQASNRNLRLFLPTVDPIWHLQADPRRIRQVLVNLVDTAIAYASEGQVQLFMEVFPDAQMVRLWVEDPQLIRVTQEPIDLVPETPISMPTTAYPGTKSRLMQAAQVPFPSAGLTLMMSRSLIQQMDGQLDILPGQLPADPVRICCMMPLITLEEDLN